MGLVMLTKSEEQLITDMRESGKSQDLLQEHLKAQRAKIEDMKLHDYVLSEMDAELTVLRELRDAASNFKALGCLKITFDNLNPYPMDERRYRAIDELDNALVKVIGFEDVDND